MAVKDNVLQNYEENWQHILEDETGQIDKDQLMKELYDFSCMIDRMSVLADKMSGGRMSYPTYTPEAMMGELEEQLQEKYDEGYADGVDDTENEHGVGKYESKNESASS